MLAALQADSTFVPHFSLRDGLLFFKGCLVLSKESTFIPMLLAEFHDTASGGHSGFTKTYKRLASSFSWKGMKGRILEYICHCDICRRHKYQAMSPAGLLQPIPIPEVAWDDISLDFITGLTLKLMGRRRLLIAAWKHFFGALFQNNPPNGIHGCHGPNSGIAHLRTLPRENLHFRWCMGAHPRLCRVSFLAKLKWILLLPSWWIEMKLFVN